MFAREAGTCLFRLSGELRHTACAGLDKLAHELEHGQMLDCKEVVVDLGQAEFLDSTNIGVLATIARGSMLRLGRRATLYSPRPEITRLLRDMCMERAFVLVDKKLDTHAELVEVGDTEADEQLRARMVLRAHEALIDLDERNREAFQPVVDAFQKPV